MSSPHHDISIDPAIRETRFSCDLAACKGACCTLPGGRGAPLLDDETRIIDSLLPLVRNALPKSHQAAIDTFGPYEGPPGDRHTTCVDDRACVFVAYDDTGVARCSFELAFHEGKTTWRKPLSCHLFPIRIDGDPAPRLRYERIDQCIPALQLGTVRDIPLVSFLNDALRRVFGDSWPTLKDKLQP